jgi:hypothetical protein
MNIATPLSGFTGAGLCHLLRPRDRGGAVGGVRERAADPDPLRLRPIRCLSLGLEPSFEQAR